MNAMTTEQKFTIEGEGKSPGQILFKVISAMAVGGVGILLILYARETWNAARETWNGNSDFAMGMASLGTLLLVAAPYLPAYRHVYLDFAARQVVTEAHYGWYCRSRRCRPLTDFGRIVVRHICIPGEGGPDTYTGSVGLKPLDGKAVLWVKNFPAAEDEFPPETHEFAELLAAWTGLPGERRGI